MGCGTVTLKSCLGIMSLFFWICAVGLIVLGSYILAEYGNIKELAQATDILVPSSILIGAGVFLFLIGLLGCIGGFKGNKAALTIFFILTLVVVVGEVVSVALAYHYRDDIETKLKQRLHTMIANCSKDAQDNRVDCDELYFMQEKFQCCGSDNYTDWFKWSAVNYTVPKSCCKDELHCELPDEDTNTTIVAKNIYMKGCATKVQTSIQAQFTWIFVGCIVLALLQTLGMVATCIMLCRSKETPYSHLDSQGYRV